MSRERAKEPSDEVDERQLELAREAGDVYLEAVDYMISEVASTGEKTTAGDYLVGIAQEKAEGMYRLDNGRFEWKEPSEDENCHLEVVVADVDDGRFLPRMEVFLTITDAQGTEMGPTLVPFVWHPGLYHYGRNFALDGDGPYDVTVDIKPAEFPRHDETNGKRYTDPVEVRFRDMEFTTGQD